MRKDSILQVDKLQQQMVTMGAQMAQLQVQIEHAKKEAKNKRGQGYTVVQGTLGSQADVNKLIKSKKLGTYNDGNGLSLQIYPANPYGKKRGTWKEGDAIVASWLVRWTANLGPDAPPDKRYPSRCMGIGSAKLIGVEEAREEAIRIRKMARGGDDPIEERKKQREDARAKHERFRTVYQVRDEYLATRLGKKSEGYRERAKQLLDDYILDKDHPVFIKVGHMPMQKFDGDVVLKHCGFEQFWNQKNPSAVELRRHLKGMYALAKYNKYYLGYNPMNWEDEGEHTPGLKNVLPPASEVHVKQQRPFLKIDDAPAFIQEKLRKYRYQREWHIIGPDGRPIPGYALEWATYSAQRIGEVITMRWEWVDKPNLKVDVPPDTLKKKKKNGQPRREGRSIPNTTSMLKILDDMQKIRPHPYNPQQRVFPLTSNNRVLKTKDSTIASQTVRRVLTKLGYGSKEVTTHGFRSTAKDWFARNGKDLDLWRIQVDHEELGSAADKSYGGDQRFEQRKRVMQEYDNYLNTPPEPAQTGGNVISFQEKNANRSA